MALAGPERSPITSTPQNKGHSLIQQGVNREMGKLSSGIPERYPISVARGVAFDDADPVGTVNITDFSKSQIS